LSDVVAGLKVALKEHPEYPTPKEIQFGDFTSKKEGYEGRYYGLTGVLELDNSYLGELPDTGIPDITRNPALDLLDTINHELMHGASSLAQQFYDTYIDKEHRKHWEEAFKCAMEQLPSAKQLQNELREDYKDFDLELNPYSQDTSVENNAEDVGKEDALPK
jgi:hypothetical protein